MARVPFLRRPLPALVVVVLLGCIAVALPLLSIGESRGGTVEATRGFVVAERPIDRILAGTALGSRPLAPVRIAAPSPAVPRPPRLVQPIPLPLALPDAEPDLRIAWLSVTAGYLPVDLPVPVMAKAETRQVAPRRKPARPPRIQAAKVAAPLPDAPATAPVRIILPGDDLFSEPKSESAPAAMPAPDPDAPRIALVVTAVGLHEATTRRAIRVLPGGVTLAFAPIGSRSGTLAKAAMADGHTVLVEIPMEPMNPRRDPGGALTLRVENSGADNVAKLDEALSGISGAAGISSYLGAKFTRSERAAAPVVDRIATRGLFLFENQPNGRSRLADLARAQDVAYATSSTILDVDRSETRMLERLTTLEMQARREGVAIGVATAYRESISALERWVAGAQRRGVVFVPVTRLEDAG